MKKIKVIIIHNIMAPYRFPLFSEIANNKNIDLEVWFLSESAKNRRWEISEKENINFKYKILPKIEFNFFKKDFFTWIFSPTSPYELIKSKYGVVISAGWLDFACLVSFFICKFMKRPYILWSESTVNEPNWRRKIALPLVSFLVKNCDALLPISTRASEYLFSLGGAKEKTFLGISSIDNDHFKKVSMIARKNKMQIKKGLKIRNKRLFLYVGRFIERKGLRTLLKAYKRFQLKNQIWGLLLVGYGPLDNELKKICQKERIQDVYFQNHIEVSEMPKIYGISDLFILPSFEETFGLVINEAMASILPIITTDKVGSSLDLIKGNGQIVKAGNVQSLLDAMEALTRSDLKLNKMGKKSLEIISKYGPRNQADAFLKAIFKLQNK